MENAGPGRPWDSWPRWLISTLVWLLVLLSWAMIAFNSHSSGHGWVPDVDWGTLRSCIEFMLPMVTALVLLRVARKLPPGKDKTVATWVGWTVFAFVLLVWPWLRLAFMMKMGA